MRSHITLAAPATGFTADPDPTVAPASVPMANLFRLPDSLTNDGAPTALQLWLESAPTGEAITVELWALDESTITPDALPVITTRIPKPDAAQRWAQLNAAVVVTAPVAQVATGRLYSGVVYVRRISSTLVAPTALKAQAYHP